ncbi:MAG: FkbM family methyltransferase [Pikeienuella sp.]
MPRIRSHYGPLMVARGSDWTNRGAILGQYGSALANAIRALPPSAVFLDIGANAGVFSLVASEVLTEGRVIAFEPNPLVFRDLLSNIELNKARNVLAINAGLGSETSVMTLAFNPHHTGGASIAAVGSTETEVPAAILEAAVLQELLGETDQKVLLKIDTEGCELRILHAMRACGFLDRIDEAWIEIDDAHLTRFGDDRTGIYELMAQTGFTPRIASPPAPGHYDQNFVRTAD